jgi:hypothetical protein
MPDECRSRLYKVRSLITEESLLLSLALDLPHAVGDLREPIAEGLRRVRAAIDAALEVLPRPD